MKHKVKTRKFGRATAPRMAMLRNLVTDLLGYEKIVTTEPKAKEIRSIAEKIITMGKGGTLAERRKALSFVYNEGVVERVFTVYGQRYASTPGGYTRMARLGPRLGDGASMVKIELIPETPAAKK
jgi:large subunit ribosomal protein L17